MNNVCIIPARAGSKRIPNKNFKDFMGKPMVCYAIETALKSDLFSQIIVSTDSPEIMDIVDEYSETNLSFLSRMVENAQDTSTTMDVINEVLDYVAEEEYDQMCCLYPCTPLLTLENFHKGFLQINTFMEYDCSMSAVRYGHPIWRAFNLRHDLSLSPIWKDQQNKPTDHLDPTFYDAGQFYWAKLHGLQEELPYGKVCAVEIPESETQDIDNEEDWIMAEIKYKYLLQKGLL